MFRVIPKIDIKGNNLVKGINLEGLRVLGDPNYFIKEYYLNGADEIFIQDVVASLYDRYSLLNIIKSISKDCFIPITVGGGIKTISDIELLLTNGADRISINSYSFFNLGFLNEIAKKFGSSTISINIQSMKINNDYFAFYDNGKSSTDIQINEWVKILQNEGIGEIILTSINKEGLMKGFDLELIENVREFIKVPLLIHGGGSSLEEIAKLKIDYNTQGVVLSSIIHYNFFLKKNLANNKINQNIKNNLPKSNTYKISEIKEYLLKRKIEVRI